MKKATMMKAFLGTLMTISLFGTQVSASDGVDMTPVAAEDSGEMVQSYLTGEQVPASIGRRRPIAMMMSNIQVACPQSGISSAGVIYEAPVEGDITRLMAIYEDYESLERMGSVRSCRDYYLFYANEFDAIYSHFGQAVYALQYLDAHMIDNLNGLEMDGTTYYRTSDRRPPHNAYTNFQRLQEGIAKMGYRQTYKEDYQGHYQFAPEGSETTLENGQSAAMVKLDNFTHNHPWFQYDEATETYLRFQFGEPQVDELNQEQLSCDNILLQYSSYQPYDGNGYLNIDTGSGGQGKFITRGKAIDIRWEKDSPWGITHYYDANEQEILLNPGKTWVEIIQNDRLDSITIQ